MKSTPFFLLTFLALAFSLPAQQTFTGIASRWSDDFSEWDIYAFPTELAAEVDPEDVDRSGEFKIQWTGRADWNSWEYTVGDERGRIKTLFPDDPGKWELVSGNNEVITFRRIWANDFREWRITNNDIQLTFKSRWGNRMDEWIVREETYGDFHMYTSWEGDPRDWIIVDELHSEVSTSMKMAMVFLAAFLSTH